MKWNRDEYLDLMTFGQSARPMLTEIFGLLVGLDDEWRRQGAAEDEISLESFDLDRVNTVFFGGELGPFNGLEPVLLEETDEYVIKRDRLGRKTKLFKKSATIPLPLEYPVKDMDSWLAIKPWFTFREDRIVWDEVEEARRERDRGAVVMAAMPGGFDFPRELMGEELACVSYYENPELMHDILDTISDTAFRVLDAISDRLVIDELDVGEDLAGKSGPLVGPKQIREFIKPYYRRVWDMLSSKGTKLFSQNSDGNMNAVVDAFLDCGVNVMYPMEPAAGMDIVALREKYGSRLAFKGGIDKHVLRQDKAAIRKELEYKLQDSMKAGTMFGLDHRITNGTPIENYRYYIDTARQLLGMPPRNK